ncbi:MAG: hypothetical protein ABSC48_18285 [Terracidiphilus sp.]|jgi:hypothetical protein
MRCKSCGIEGPTQHVTLWQNVGMIVARQWKKIDGDLCHPCIRKYFRSYTLTTLFLGWWGVVSLVVTPFILINNVYQFFRTSGLPEPELTSGQLGSRL